MPSGLATDSPRSRPSPLPSPRLSPLPVPPATLAAVPGTVTGTALAVSPGTRFGLCAAARETAGSTGHRLRRFSAVVARRQI